MPIEGIAALYGDHPQNRGDAQSAPRHDWFFALARDLESGDLTAALHDWEQLMRSPAVRQANEQVRNLAAQLGRFLRDGDLLEAGAVYGRLEEATGFHSTAILPRRAESLPARVDVGGAERLDSLLQQADAPAAMRQAATRYLTAQNEMAPYRSTPEAPPVGDESRFRQATQAYAPVFETERRVGREFREEEIEEPLPDAGARFEYHPAFIPNLVDGDARHREPYLRRRATIFWLLLFNLAALLVTAAIVGARIESGWLVTMLAGVLFFDWLLWAASRPTDNR